MLSQSAAWNSAPDNRDICPSTEIPVICPELNISGGWLTIPLPWFPAPPQHPGLEVVVPQHLGGRSGRGELLQSHSGEVTVVSAGTTGRFKNSKGKDD